MAIQRYGQIGNASLGKREEGKTPGDALRRPRQSAQNAFLRVAAEVPTTNSATTTKWGAAPSLDTVPQQTRNGQARP